MSHWYDKNGEPRYTVPYANLDKGSRPTTLRDARKNNWVPSVTTVMQIAAKPGLDVWKTEQVLQAAYNNTPPKITGDLTEYSKEIYKYWKREVLAVSRKVAEDAADTGTKIHDALELWIKTGKIKKGYKKYITAVDECLSCLPKTEWIAEDSFCHSGGFGGKIDLHCKFNDAGEGIIIDFKTKSSSDKFAIYDEHAMQLAAYGRGLNIPDAVCYNLFISTEEEVVTAELIEHTPENIERGWNMFQSLLQFWQLSNRYIPRI